MSESDHSFCAPHHHDGKHTREARNGKLSRGNLKSTFKLILLLVGKVNTSIVYDIGMPHSFCLFSWAIKFLHFAWNSFPRMKSFLQYSFLESIQSRLVAGTPNCSRMQQVLLFDFSLPSAEHCISACFLNMCIKSGIKQALVCGFLTVNDLFRFSVSFNMTETDW